MIAGALEIMRGVRGTLMHPLLLPGAQGPDLLGYIVIAYEDRGDLFDILFVRGSRVEEYGCLYGGLRTLLTEAAVRFALSSCRLKCRVYLYALTRQTYNAFLSTFQCAPSLNVAVDGLSRKQIASLASGICCANGILEVVRPASPFPSISLVRFHSEEELLEHAAHVREGRILAYDVELNAMLGGRSRAEIAAGSGELAGAQSQCPPARDPVPAGEESGAEAPPAQSPTITLAPSPAPPAAPLPVTPPTPLPPLRSAPPMDGGRGHTPMTADVQLLVAAFGQVLDEFERAGREIFGSRVERNVPRITAELFPGVGSFSERVESVSGAVSVLSVIRQCVAKSTPLGKRALRRAAREIVREFYQDHQKLLYRCGVENEVRDCYRILAGERPGAAGAL